MGRGTGGKEIRGPSAEPLSLKRYEVALKSELPVLLLECRE